MIYAIWIRNSNGVWNCKRFKKSTSDFEEVIEKMAKYGWILFFVSERVLIFQQEGEESG